jgi:type IV pilus assembly protein PilA
MSVRRNLNRGFTLVEIMIVVGIIVLLVAVAIPGLLRGRLNANEASAIASLKTIASASMEYRSGNPSYPSNLSELAASNPPYVDSVLGSGSKQGYNFSYSSSIGNFNVMAQPVIVNVTGVRSFFVDATGVIRAAGSGNATSSSTPI